MTEAFVRGFNRAKMRAMLESDPIELAAFERPGIPGQPGCPIEWATPAFVVPPDLLYVIADVRDTTLPEESSVRFIVGDRTVGTFHRHDDVASLSVHCVPPRQSFMARVSCRSPSRPGTLRIMGWWTPA